MRWTPNPTKDYHPVCEQFFEREISKKLVKDLFAEMDRQSCAYDQYLPASYATPLDRDERLRADLLECFAFVLERLYLLERFSSVLERLYAQAHTSV
jgi:hypothetical protein